MQISYKIYFLLSFTLLFIGCAKNEVEVKTISKEEKKIEKSIKKEKIEKKEEIKKSKKKPKKEIKKSKNIYKDCYKHRKVMTHASNYIYSEFQKGYFNKKDTIGAKAQLFLIENKSPAPFSKNINAALESYKKQYLLAKKHKCNLKNFKITPLEKIKIKIKNIEKKGGR